MNKIISLLSIGLFCFMAFQYSRFENTHRSPASLKKKKILLGIDGFDKRSFDYYQKELGLFQQFGDASVHIAPFPSISDYSWNKIVHSKEIYGRKGRIKSYEAAYYDASKNAVVDDTREYFRRIGQENHYYSGAFQIFFNPYIESFLYLPSKKLPLVELEQLRNEIISDSNSDFTSVLVASVDAIAHTQGENEFLIRGVDKFITDLIEDHRKLGIDPEIMIVSDHGQDYDFEISQEPKELRVANIQKAISDSGFNIKRSLHSENDVAVPLMALGNYVGVHFKDLSKREVFAEALSKYEWFEHSIYLQERKDSTYYVKIYDSKGFATLKIIKSTYGFEFKYSPVSSNPLELDSHNHNKLISEEESFNLQKQSSYPDSFYRIAQAISEDEADFPDLIFTLKGEFRVKGDLDQFTKMFRTHGSLHKNSSNGIVVSNKNASLKEFIRTDDILDELDISPNDLFRENLEVGLLSKTKNSIEQATGKIKTGAQTYNSKRVFGLINRFVNYSQYVLNVDSLDTFKSLFKEGAGDQIAAGNVSAMNFDFSNTEKIQVLSMEDMGTLLDIVLETPEWQKIELDPRFIEIKQRVMKDLEKLQAQGGMKGDGHTHLSQEELITKASGYTHAAKTLVMKQYSMPFLFKRALSFPEFSTIDDVRDLTTATFQSEISQKSRDYSIVTQDPEPIKKLFKEVFLERSIVDNIYPQKIQTFYNSKMPEDITIVYLPGIYNSIFNNEIFAMGLDSLRNNLGMRVVSAPLMSACDSEYNGNIIIDFLKKDIAYRESRGRSKQKYFLLGYSKGSVDALYSFKKDPRFIKENIQGMMSIASPILGTSILKKSDLPIMLLELLGNENIPQECRKKHWASKTISPDAALRFFKENGTSLSSLTRYYSISFVSDIKDSHIWMQATKQIAGFQEANDGVVELSASKYPKGFGAIDFGEVNADHLSGIVASEFAQSAFLESLMITLEKIGAFDSRLSKDWLAKVEYDSELTDPDLHRRKLLKIFDDMSLDDRKLSEYVEKKLENTPYKVESFKVKKQKDGTYRVRFRKRSKEGLYSVLFYYNETQTINSKEELIDILLSEVQSSGKDLLISEKEAWRNYPVSDRAKIILPESTLAYLPDFRINLKSLESYMSGSRVTPMIPENYPEGINIIYDHQTPILFREEYKLNYESTVSLSPDNNPESGYISHLTEEGDIVAKMSSKNTSIRLTTFSMRFMPKDFKNMSLRLKVTNNVENANVLFGGSGKDDSAFQIWYTIRINKKGSDRTKFNGKDESFIFGYYWGDKVKGKELVDGNIYENYYSEKNFIIAVLPEAKQLLLGHKEEDLNLFKTYNRSLYDDLKEAFPNRDIDNAEIVGITFQHDSNDTQGDSEAFFKELKFK